MQIKITYDASVSSAPAAFKTDVAYVVAVLDAAFTNNVTINIKVGWGEVGGAPLYFRRPRRKRNRDRRRPTISPRSRMR